MSADEINRPLPVNLHVEVISTPPALDSNPHGEPKWNEAVPSDSGP